MSKTFKERIDRLETALRHANLPWWEICCHCCGRLFVPPHDDSVRCSECCLGCRYDRKMDEWIRGRSCPFVKKETA